MKLPDKLMANEKYHKAGRQYDQLNLIHINNTNINFADEARQTYGFGSNA